MHMGIFETGTHYLVTVITYSSRERAVIGIFLSRTELSTGLVLRSVIVLAFFMAVHYDSTN